MEGVGRAGDPGVAVGVDLGGHVGGDEQAVGGDIDHADAVDVAAGERRGVQRRDAGDPGSAFGVRRSVAATTLRSRLVGTRPYGNTIRTAVLVIRAMYGGARVLRIWRILASCC